MRKYPVFLACFLLLLSMVAQAGATATIAPAGVSAASLAMMADEDAPQATPTPEPTNPPVESTDFILEPTLGYDGLMLMLHWTPTFVTVTNNGPDFDGVLGVNVFLDQTTYDRYDYPLTLASGATKDVVLPIIPQTRQDVYAFELIQDGKIVAEKRVAAARLAAPEAVTIGLLSDDPEALAYMDQRANGLDTLRGEVWTTIPLHAENFPENAELMRGFCLLVVDGVDVRTLSQAQQEALRAWLLDGGIAIVSGGAKAAASYPFFAEWTELSAGKLAQGEDITPDLLAYITTKGEAAGEPVWLNALPAGGALISSGASGLIQKDTAGEGIVYTAAFDLGGKPVAGWTSMQSFWPRVLRQSASTQYMTMLNRMEETRYGGGSDYRARELVSSLTVQNGESGIPVLAVLALYIALAGFVGYLLLKRLDRREWMWGTVPVLSVVFTMLLLLLSRGSTMNEPVALTASRVSLDGDVAQVSTYIGIATPNDGEMLIQTDQRQLPNVLQDESYYWQEDTSTGSKLFRPIDLRQRYRYGADPAVGFQSAEAWDTKLLSLSGIPLEIGTLGTGSWMEADGLHGELTNGTEHTFKDCLVVTSFGFSEVGDLLPGQTASFAMLYPKGKVDPTANNFKIQPNTLYSTLDMDLSSTQGGYYDSNLHTYLNRALYNEDYSNKQSQRKHALVQTFEDQWNFYQNNGTLYFFGFNDSIGRVSASLNGEPIDRTGHTAVLGSRIDFEPIGPTGQVLFLQGMIRPEVLVDQGPDKPPREATEDDIQSGNQQNAYGLTEETYLNLGSPVALRYTLPQWGEYRITRLTLSGMSYEDIPTLALYNYDTSTWDEQLLLTVSMDGEGWAPYINDDGELLARYTPGETANRYSSMSMPNISMKGEV